MGEGIWGLMELFAFCLFLKCLTRFAQPSNFGDKDAAARTQPQTPERRGVGVRLQRVGSKSDRRPANSWMAVEQALSSVSSKGNVVTKCHLSTLTRTPHTSTGGLSVRVCMHGRSAPA